MTEKRRAQCCAPGAASSRLPWRRRTEPPALCLLVQHQLAVAIQRDFRARIVVHTDFALLIANFVRDVIAQQFLRFIIDRLATLTVGGIGIPILQITLHLIARIPPRQRAGHGGDISAPLAADGWPSTPPATVPNTEPAILFSSCTGRRWVTATVQHA